MLVILLKSPRQHILAGPMKSNTNLEDWGGVLGGRLVGRLDTVGGGRPMGGDNMLSRYDIGSTHTQDGLCSLRCIVALSSRRKALHFNEVLLRPGISSCMWLLKFYRQPNRRLIDAHPSYYHHLTLHCFQ